MSSACTGCAKNFGIFSKEHCCPSCGFVYCGKCLSEKKEVKGKVTSVCRKCSVKLTPKKEIIDRILEDVKPPDHPIKVYRRDSSKYAELKRGLSKLDEDIIERLERLKEPVEKKKAPTEDEMMTRLAQLSDIDPEIYKKPNVLPKEDKRGATEQTSDLFNQMVDECKLDKVSTDRDDELRSRLEQLQGRKLSQNDLNKKELSMCAGGSADAAEDMDEDVDEAYKLMRETSAQVEREASEHLHALHTDKEIAQEISKLKIRKKKELQNLPAESEENNESEDENAAIESLVEKILAEPDSEDEFSDRGAAKDNKIINKNPDAQMSEELPWCSICNEDATIRCKGCDGDLYCSSCYKEFHDDEDHQHVPYTK